MCAANALTAIWIGRGGAGQMVRKYQTKQTFIYLTIQISSLLFSQLLQLWLISNLKKPVPPGEKKFVGWIGWWWKHLWRLSFFKRWWECSGNKRWSIKFTLYYKKETNKERRFDRHWFSKDCTVPFLTF